MTIPSLTASPTGTLIRPLALLVAVAAGICAAEDDLRITPQVMLGTSGIEPGVALEWRGQDLSSIVLRPEVLLSEDGRPGAGGAILYDLGSMVDLPSRQSLAIGPRAVYHNADDSGWEIDALATWGWNLSGSTTPWKHTVGVLAAVGVVKDKKHDETDVGASAGAFYSYRF